MSIPTLLTPQQAADKLNIKRSYVYELIKDGKLRVIPFGPKCLRIEETEIERFLNELKAQPTAREIAANHVFHNRRRA